MPSCTQLGSRYLGCTTSGLTVRGVAMPQACRALASPSPLLLQTHPPPPSAPLLPPLLLVAVPLPLLLRRPLRRAHRSSCISTAVAMPRLDVLACASWALLMARPTQRLRMIMRRNVLSWTTPSLPDPRHPRGLRQCLHHAAVRNLLFPVWRTFRFAFDSWNFSVCRPEEALPGGTWLQVVHHQPRQGAVLEILRRRPRANRADRATRWRR